MASEISGIARMNIAAADDASLATLQKWFTKAAEHGDDTARELAPQYLAVIEQEMALRGREPS